MKRNIEASFELADRTELISANDTNPMLGKTYFSRKLVIADKDMRGNLVDETGLLTLPGNKVVLGEPGMGKSELMCELGRRLEVEIVTAIRLINARNPDKLVTAGKPLLIDGLDEAMSRREGDAVDAILAQLEDAGSPQFILSCRSREWQARGQSNMRRVYRSEPHIMTLEPFDRSEARAFLLMQTPTLNADQVLDHLASYDLEDLYRNPLTLGLMGQIAKAEIQLPATRAKLFERTCCLIWPEHDSDRQDEGLAQLTQEEALSAAGAIAAGLLFGGAEAVSAAGAAQVQPGDIRLAELEALPNANAARAIFSSKLFHSVGPTRAKVIHRVMAEFLGARWLAHQTSTPRAQRRLLAQLHGSGGVPASLRGLHAWLAYHSPAIAERVIAQDPYGVLRYGEVNALKPHLAASLLDALSKLADEDPYFRAQDWGQKTATGLMIPALKHKIELIIASETSNLHLRSLLIEGLQGTSLAAELATTLESIVLASERSYRERHDAIKALLPHRERVWWRKLIETLISQGGEDAPRLARQVIQEIDIDVTNELLVETLFAELGVTGSPRLKRTGRRIHHIRSYTRFIAAIPSERLICILDLISNYSEQPLDADWEIADDLADIVANLVIRGISEAVIGVTEAPSLWRWLEAIERSHSPRRTVQQALATLLDEHCTLRRAVQTHALNNTRHTGSLWATERHLQQRFVSLAGRPDDICLALNRLAQGDNSDPELRQDWQNLVSIAVRPDGLDANVRSAAKQFCREDKTLDDLLRKLERPQKPEWQLQDERAAAKRSLEREARFNTHRRSFGANRGNLRTGELSAILQPAHAYLNRFSDLPSDLPPNERLSTWLGPELCEDALIGFEAVLHRSDLPTPGEISAGLASGKTYNFSYPIMAGLYERMRSGRGLAELSSSLHQAALLLALTDHGWNLEGENEALIEALEAEVLPTPESRQAFARLWIEPALSAGKTNVPGLYQLSRSQDWQATGVTLSAEWLTRFPNLPEIVEAELLDCLSNGVARHALCEIAMARNETTFRDIDHLLMWLAVDIVFRFKAVRPDLSGIGERHPNFIWFLRNRLQFERRGRMLPVDIEPAEWIITEFRSQWPYAMLEGAGCGTQNDYDATDFLTALIRRIADETTNEAAEAMARLIACPKDSYAELIRHMAMEQKQKRAEEGFTALTPPELSSLLNDGPPGNIDDLKALVLEEIALAQRILIGDDLDSVIDFWNDEGVPRSENRCRDRLAALIGPGLARYGIQRLTEADMPQTKRADLAFACESMQLPVEIKGQWHSSVWDAATQQLDVQYLIDWRSEQRGVYCVLWFGELPAATNRRLKTHPDGALAPNTAEEMQTMLVERIPEARRAHIDIVVLDLSSGKNLSHREKSTTH